MVNRTISAFAALSPREKRWLTLGGLGAWTIAGYFFMIAPLHKKTMQQQQIADTRLTQLGDMQRMAADLAANQGQADSKAGAKSSTASTKSAAEVLLAGLIADETLENGQRVLSTKAVPAKQAKALLRQLAPLGKVAIYSHAGSKSAATLEVRFWVN